MVTTLSKGQSSEGDNAETETEGQRKQAAGCVMKDKLSSTMPQPMAVSILLRTETMETGDENNELSSKNSYMLPTVSEPTSAHSGYNDTLNMPPVPPHHGGERGAQAENLGKSDTVSQMNLNNQECKHQSTHSKDNKSIKRMKKVARPRTKAASRGVRKLPTKKDTGAIGSKVSGKCNAMASNPPTPIKKRGGESKAAAVHKLPLSKDIHPETNHSKAKRSMLLPPDDESTKKKIKKKRLNPTDSGTVGSNISTAKSEAASNHNQGGKSVQETSVTGKKPVTEDSQIKKLVSVVVDSISREIRYLATVFVATTNQSTAAINIGEDLPSNKATSSATTASAEPKKYPAGCNPNESVACGKYAQLSNPGLHDSTLVNKNHVSVSISEKGDIHPLKSSARPEESSKCSITSHAISRKKSETFSHGNSLYSEMNDISTVVATVKRFVLEVYYPFLLLAKKSMGNISPNADRIRLSTLLAIREMLVMNADKVFTFSTVKRPYASMKEEAYLPYILANAIVRNTAKRLHSLEPEGSFFADFLQAAQNYDTNSDDFQFSLPRADARSVYLHPKGKKVGSGESVVAKVGFNYARARHPLLYSKWIMKDDEQMGIVEKLSHPVSTACAVFHFERVSASDETKDTEKVLESLKRVLGGKQMIQGKKN